MDGLEPQNRTRHFMFRMVKETWKLNARISPHIVKAIKIYYIYNNIFINKIYYCLGIVWRNALSYFILTVVYSEPDSQQSVS